MRALDLLRADHRHLQSLFESLRQTADFGERRDLFEEVRDSLELHADLEERVFYPVFRRNPQWAELIEEAIEDHRLMDEMVTELGVVHDAEDFSDLLDELVEAIEEHFVEEESELFPALIPLLAETEWVRLANEMEAYREIDRAA
ncbi:MAG: hemerythrin domain-containing protein [Oligoflexia bacterium]|jgi:hemerythrin superfamily protein